VLTAKGLYDDYRHIIGIYTIISQYSSALLSWIVWSQRSKFCGPHMIIFFVKSCKTVRVEAVTL